MNALKLQLHMLKASEAESFDAIHAAEEKISTQTVKAAEAKEEIAKCIALMGTLQDGSSHW